MARLVTNPPDNERKITYSQLVKEGYNAKAIFIKVGSVYVRSTKKELFAAAVNCKTIVVKSDTRLFVEQLHEK